MQTLIQAVEQQDTLLSGLLIARESGSIDDVSAILQQMEDMASDAQFHLRDTEEPKARFLALISYFYSTLAFSGRELDMSASQYSLMDYVFSYRTGTPICLGTLLIFLGKRAGINIEGVSLPGHFILRFRTDDHAEIYINPLNGQTLGMQQIADYYQAVCGMGSEFEDEVCEDQLNEFGIPLHMLEKVCSRDMTVRLLQNLKAAFIKEGKFGQAMKSVDMLILLCPNDPYERRDRGFILLRLNCHKLALADYKHFIKHCPQDPAAHLLKLQLRHFEEGPSLILH